ncbi:MAG TPA: hypothetical protein DD990_13765 [Cyanobacteria bacterium UBA11368]|nr:hypothetical protein [Cyanobacteria bacterium UBA11368]
MSEIYNQRQYQRIIEAIEAYEHKRIRLAQLISDLEALVESLENISYEWRSLLLSQWGMLEDVYAYTLDEGRTDLEEEDISLISQALAELKELVKLQIEEANACI